MSRNGSARMSLALLCSHKATLKVGRGGDEGTSRARFVVPLKRHACQATLETYTLVQIQIVLNELRRVTSQQHGCGRPRHACKKEAAPEWNRRRISTRVRQTAARSRSRLKSREVLETDESLRTAKTPIPATRDKTRLVAKHAGCVLLLRRAAPQQKCA